MIYVPRPIKPPTGEELTVLFWVLVLIVIGFGAVCLFFGYRAPVEKAEEASKLIRGGWSFVAAGGLMIIVRRVV